MLRIPVLLSDARDRDARGFEGVPRCRRGLPPGRLGGHRDRPRRGCRGPAPATCSRSRQGCGSTSAVTRPSSTWWSTSTSNFRFRDPTFPASRCSSPGRCSWPTPWPRPHTPATGLTVTGRSSLEAAAGAAVAAAIGPASQPDPRGRRPDQRLQHDRAGHSGRARPSGGQNLHVSLRPVPGAAGRFSARPVCPPGPAGGRFCWYVRPTQGDVRVSGLGGSGGLSNSQGHVPAARDGRDGARRRRSPAVLPAASVAAARNLPAIRPQRFARPPDRGFGRRFPIPGGELRIWGP